jgi:FkbM family methyltransferase
MIEPELRIQALAARLQRYALGPHLLAMIAETEHGLFAVDPEDRVVGRQLVNQGSYAAEELERLKASLSPESNVLVVGAHIGALVVPLCKHCRTVVAFEANPATYRLLKLNLLLNEVSNCRAFNLAASDEDGSLDFLLSRANSGGSKRVPLIRKFKYYYDNPKTVVVDARRLDDCVGDTRFDLIVMDIEGSEYFALRGMQKTLGSSKRLAVEFLPHHLRNVSGASVGDFVALIEPHFSTLTIPSKKLSVSRPDFRRTLQEMYDRDEGDDGIIFEKSE